MSVYYYLVFLGLYTCGYVFLVFATLADGHGTFLFATPLLGWLLFALAFLLIPYADKNAVLGTILSCMGLFYVITIAIAFIEQSGEGNFSRTLWLLNRSTVLFVLTILWFLAGQVLFWVLLIKRLRQTKALQ